MKAIKVLGLAGIVAIAVLAGACTDAGDLMRADVGNVAVLQLSAVSADLAAAAGDSDETTIVITNTGRDTLRITSVSSSDGAFAVVSYPEEVLPDGAGDLVIRFHGTGSSVTGTITVVSNSIGGDAEVTLAGSVDGSGSTTPTYTSDILPIFQTSCIKSGCHAEVNPQAGLYLGSYTQTVARITVGQPNQSLLYTYLQSGYMPFDAGQLPQEQRDLVRDWIAGGAPQ